MMCPVTVKSRNTKRQIHGTKPGKCCKKRDNTDQSPPALIYNTKADNHKSNNDTKCPVHCTHILSHDIPPIERHSYMMIPQTTWLSNAQTGHWVHRINFRNVTGRVRKYDGSRTSPMFVRRISMYLPSSASYPYPCWSNTMGAPLYSPR